jgi:hypothetical protein
MVEPSSFYTRFASRSGFNASVRHINRTLDVLDSCNPKKNVADEVNRLLAAKELESSEVQSVVNMLLIEKGKYQAVARNLTVTCSEPAALIAEVAKWKAIDLVIGYHHPDLGFIVLNPKNPDMASVISGFRKNELAVIYAGSEVSTDTAAKNVSVAIGLLYDLLENRAAKAPASFLNGPYSFVAPKVVKEKKAAAKPKAERAPKYAPSVAKTATMYTGPECAPSAAPVAVAPPPAAPAAPAPGQSRMSSLVSVVVTNELFHNGNVEAWKRIIRSYNAKYPNLQVFIYYDGERIVDINTLFKWGKVKHGSCIQFCVAGENIQDLAKLSRYFRQGASSSFEAFLHGSPDTVMNLF